MNESLTRRQFLHRAGCGLSLAAASLGFPSLIRARGLNEKLNIASVGTSGRAGANLAGVASENIVAVADVDATMLEAAVKQYPGARRYEDFRVMLEKEADNLDAVVVSTPDHTHAVAAAQAMKMGKHVYCEKPLAHTVHEVRHLTDLAREEKLITQMGTQIHAGDNYRRVVELVRSGALGTVREVHVWVNIGHSYSGGRFTTDTPAPAGLNWDLWLGPAAKRPYTKGVHPFDWRKFWDFGNGRLGDFGCHYMDLVHWALDLRHPVKVRSEGPPVDPISTPEWLVVHYDYPARGEQPPVQLTWHGNRTPAILSGLKKADGQPLDWGSGQLFVGDRGMVVSDYGRHMLLPAESFQDFQRPEPSIPKSMGHHAEWIHAIKTGGATTCPFDYSGPLTESVLLGVASYRSGEEILFDAKNMRIAHSPKAQALLSKEYRKGWVL